jgi:hypothetical protein
MIVSNPTVETEEMSSGVSCAYRYRDIIMAPISFLIARSLTRIFPFLLLAAPFIGCGVTQPVRVIDRGTTQAAVSLGGPLIPFGGMNVPAPYLNLGLIHGYKENLTLTGNIHAAMALLKNAAFDVGATTRLAREDSSFSSPIWKGSTTRASFQW